jgi:ABC-type sulfate transport system substrate-binding protein
MKEGCGKEAMGKMFGGPDEMFKTMTSGAQKTDELAKYATSELRALFEDWLIQLEEEIIALAEKREMTKPEEVAEAFKISKESAIFILDKLVQKGKIKISGISIQKEDDNGNDG